LGGPSLTRLPHTTLPPRLLISQWWWARVSLAITVVPTPSAPGATLTATSIEMGCYRGRVRERSSAFVCVPRPEEAPFDARTRNGVAIERRCCSKPALQVQTCGGQTTSRTPTRTLTNARSKRHQPTPNRPPLDTAHENQEPRYPTIRECAASAPIHAATHAQPAPPASTPLLDASQDGRRGPDSGSEGRRRPQHRGFSSSSSPVAVATVPGSEAQYWL